MAETIYAGGRQNTVRDPRGRKSSIAIGTGRSANGAGYVKKSSRLLCQKSTLSRAQARYKIVEEHPEYPVAKWAKVLEIGTSGYYVWKARKEKQQQAKESLQEKLRELYEQGRGTYGVERICGLLRKAGYRVSYRRIKRELEELGLSSIHRKRRQRSLTDSRRARGDGYENRVKGKEITEVFTVLSSDISYVRTGEGFGYLCQIQDIVSKVVLAQKMMKHMRAE